MIHIDFETRSQVDIWQVGAWNYSCDDSTEILCLAYAIEDSPVLIMSYDDFRVDYRPSFLSNIDKFEVVAHNALFEQVIWQNILVKRYGWPRIPIKQWRCSAAKAAARSLPRSLELCAKVLNTPHQKDMSGKRTMLKLARSTGEIDKKELEILYEYCRQDVEVERDIDKALPDLTEKEQLIWFHDQLINQRGVAVDKEAVDSAIRLIGEHTKHLNSEIVTLTNGALDGVSRRTAVMNWINKQLVSQKSEVKINGYTKKDVQDLLAKPLPEGVRRVLETRVQLGKTSVAKYEAMQNAVDEDGRIRDLLLYHGASTGRWSGKLVQIQNLPSSKGEKYNMDDLVQTIKKGPLEEMELLYGDIMKYISLAIRGMFVGNDLLVADYNAIEARVLFWLADDQVGLKAYREGRDIYVDTARAIYNKPNIGKAERQLGKTAVLGCGYGMGVNKFLATCLNFGLEVNADIAERAVKGYRSLFNAVPRLWRAVEQGAIHCISTRENTRCGKIQWSMDGNVLLCRLPSGRSIAYNEAKLGDGKILFKSVDSTTHQWADDDTYGGKLVENCTQAIARDILAEAMLRAERAGYPIVMHVHDEAVAESDKPLDRFVKLLEVQPDWAKDLPLKVEGFACKRYQK